MEALSKNKREKEITDTENRVDCGGGRNMHRGGRVCEGLSGNRKKMQ